MATMHCEPSWQTCAPCSGRPGYVAVLRGLEHVFALVNDAFRRTVGERDLLGQLVRKAMPELAGQGFFELLDEVYKTGRPFVGHQMPMMLQRQPNGSVEQMFLDFVYQPIIGAEGQVSGIFIEGSPAASRNNRCAVPVKPPCARARALPAAARAAGQSVRRG